DPKPTQTSTAVGSDDLQSVLLSQEDIQAIVGNTGLEATAVVERMDDTTTTMSNPNCTGILGTAIASVYADSGYSYVRDQAFSLDDPEIWIAQTAVSFPSGDPAHKFLNSLADKWNGCAGQTVTVGADNGSERWTIGNLDRSESKLVQGGSVEGADGYACQHVV